MSISSNTSARVVLASSLSSAATPGDIVFLTVAGVGIPVGLYQSINTDTWANIASTSGSGSTSNITPGANFTITQNGVASFTTVESGAIVNTIKLDSGILLIGTSASKTSATSGSIVLPNNTFLRGTTSAGTNTRGLVGFSSANLVLVDSNGVGAIFGASISVGLGGVFPTTNGAADLGKSGNGWRSLYTGHLIGNYSVAAPTWAAGTGAGTSPTLFNAGTDLAGTITVVTGTVPTGTNAIIATATFAVAYTSAPGAVILFPANAATALLSGLTAVYVDQATISTTSFVIKSGTTGLVAATTYLWYYIVIQ